MWNQTVYILLLVSSFTQFGGFSYVIALLLLFTNIPHYFNNKGLNSQSYNFSNCHVWMCELDHKEGRALKN